MLLNGFLNQKKSYIYSTEQQTGAVLRPMILFGF